jgi:prepilin-type N-terminal cleavage/methylation domain-containing protein
MKIIKYKAQGFTLIEIMLAMAIFAMVLASIYATWYTVVKGSKVGLDAAANAQRSRITLQTISEALSGIQYFQANNQYYSFEADTQSSDFAAISFVSHLPKSFVGSGMFGDLSVRRVSFWVEPSTNGSMDLVLWQEPLLVQTNINDEIGPTVLAHDVSLFQLEFWDTQTGGWITEWLYTNQIPKLIRVTIGFGSSGGYYSKPTEIYTRTIALQGMAVAQAYQVPRIGAGAPTGLPAGQQPGRGQPPGQGQPQQGRQPGQGRGGFDNNFGNFPGGFGGPQRGQGQGRGGGRSGNQSGGGFGFPQGGARYGNQGGGGGSR